MDIYLNEIRLQVPEGTRLFALRDTHRPKADILILNGHLLTTDHDLEANDRVVLIERGVQPDAEELEALMMARHTPGVHERVKAGRVGIAGVGGLGSSIAIALARTGVGRLVIADYDVVEPSNLNRQQYFIDQLGKPKVEALAETIKRINPHVDLVCRQLKLTAENLAATFVEVDILVEALDAAEQKTMLVNTWLRKYPDRALVTASGVAGFAASNSIKTRQIRDNLILCGDGVTAAEPGCGLMAPRVGIAAHHQANAVLRLLLNEEID
ncbi:MAG: thiamine biosynthesis protein ThiF [Desulfuromonas sp.]|nr:MAG: thiamine biosynthesis protein ThiF [Desulfuromonas sp.]